MGDEIKDSGIDFSEEVQEQEEVSNIIQEIGKAAVGA